MSVFVRCVAAKQAAFEEQNRIKNQFRALDDDEADFLDEVRERKRRAEEEVRRETEQGLQAFRQAQKGEGDAEAEAGKEGSVGADGRVRDGEVSWGVGRKRRRVKEREVKGVKRKVSTGGGEKQTQTEKMKEKEKDDDDDEGEGEGEGESRGEKSKIKTGDIADGAKADKPQVTTKSLSKPPVDVQTKVPAALGLVDYGSDSDG